MAQGVLPYKYEGERNHMGITVLAGLPIYLDLESVFGVADCIGAHVDVPMTYPPDTPPESKGSWRSEARAITRSGI